MARFRGRRTGNFWNPETWVPWQGETGRQEAADISARMASVMREIYPKPTVLERWGYQCTWYDAASGIEFGTYLYSATETVGASYQKASYDARKLAMQARPACIDRLIGAGHDIKLRCKRMGDPIRVR